MNSTRRIQILALIVLSGLTSCSYFSSGKKERWKEKILFVGNSYTLRNRGVDQQLASLMNKEDRLRYYFTRAAQGKFHLLTHWNNEKTLEKVEEHKWNKVVLQEYSSGSLRNPNEFMRYGKKWAQRMRRINPKTKLFLYATWGYENTKNMADSVYTNYQKLGEEIDAEVVPVGLLWKELKPKYDLYDADGAHPNHKGTFVTACLFYEYLYDKDCRYTPLSDTLLSNDLQKSLKEEVHRFRVNFDNEM